MTYAHPPSARGPRPVRAARHAVVTATATACALVGGALLLPGAVAAAAPVRDAAPAAPAASPAAAHDLTLVTGDVVHFTDRPGTVQDTVTVDRPEGATGGVQIQQSGDHVFVVPDEAGALLAAGKLDRRLFDVTTLTGMGYDDARTGGVPLIATYRAGVTAPAGSTVARRLPSIDGAALRADKARARTFWRDVTGAAPRARSLDGGIAGLWLDGRVGADLAESVPQINAPQAWAEGYDGTGRTVAVLDTGVDDTHPDLRGRIAAERSFVPDQAVADGNGHGTHVASTVAGNGATYRGVAPGARLLVGKVLSDAGYGEDSWIIAGMEWAKAQGADVVSMSLGSDVPDDGTAPMARAVDALSADGGPLFVIAAGNAYSGFTIGAPGSAASALTVASVTKSDERSDFSSMGPLTGSYGLKPDISAPGSDITAAKPGGGYQTMSGTSMATPHVAGAAAVLKQRHPGWSAAQLKDALMSTSERLTDYTPYEQGTGRVDVLNAVDSAVQATGSVATAFYDWPHGADDPAATRTVTYRNSGTKDVTLDLATDTDAAAYTLSARSVTVPAGGSAEVTLRLDPSSVAPATTFSGQVLATDHATGALAAHTGFALVKERELYDYTVELKDREGKPASGWVYLGAENDSYQYPYAVDGERTLRLPPGAYTAYTYLDVPGDRPDSLGLAFLSAPRTVLDRPVTVALDASRARKVSASVPKDTADSQRQTDFAVVSADGGVIRSGYQVPLKYDSLWAQPTGKVTGATMTFSTRWRLREKQIAVGSVDDVLVQPGSTPDEGTRRLGTVYAGHGAAADYAGLDARGRAVVVDRSDAVAPVDRAANAAAAGAALLIVVNDGDGRLNEVYGDDAGLPVVSVMRGDRDRVLARKLTVTQRAQPRWIYDLVSQHDGAVPDRSLAYTPDPDRDLARVDAVYYGGAKTSGGGFRYNIPAYGPGFGFSERESYPSERTEWLTPLRGAAFWYEDHSVLGPQDEVLQEMRSGDDRVAAGRHYRTQWFAPVQRPRLGQGFWGPSRDVNGYLQFNITPWTDSGAGHSGSMPADEYDTGSIALYQGDTLLRKSAGRALSLFDPAPAEVLPYRLVLDASRDAGRWRTSVRSHTEWGFRSGAVPDDGTTWQQDIPLLQLDYDVATDRAGDVRAGGRVALGLSAATQEWLERVTHATSASLSVSYDDGRTWQPAALHRVAGAGRWTAELRTPRDPGGFVSLRATASDGRGGTVDQEIDRAFGLR
ncbi:S8 family serine peptidase [Streptomyces sp. NPDC002574]|uniref:S8 family peptidase n=1 Tax=Streptomyces sp. NPDC002574 TaxID=3364652 RepID=UPI0036C77749